MVIDANYKMSAYICPCCNCDKIIEKFKADNCRTNKLASFYYVRCAACNSLYVVPSPITNLTHNNYDKRYIQTYNKLIEKLKNKSYRFFACWMYGLLSGFSHINLPRHFKKNDTLLDIGCGIGLQTKLLLKNGMKITGIDSSQQAIEFANAISDGEEFISTELEQFQSTKNVDYIRLDNVIEHIDNLGDFFKRLSQILNPDGKIIVFTPNAESASIKFLKGKSVSAWPEEHRVIFSKKGLTLLLENHGYKITLTKRNTPAWWLAYNFFMLIGKGKEITADSFSLKLLSFVFLPLTFILNLFHIEEELILIAEKV